MPDGFIWTTPDNVDSPNGIVDPKGAFINVTSMYTWMTSDIVVTWFIIIAIIGGFFYLVATFGTWELLKYMAR